MGIDTDKPHAAGAFRLSKRPLDNNIFGDTTCVRNSDLTV
jgi:hypothetical protein